MTTQRTPITDRNGKPTHVHRNVADASRSAQRVGGIETRRNTFSNIDNLADLESALDIISSPENLWRDGEASRAEVERATAVIKSDYEKRLKELSE